MCNRKKICGMILVAAIMAGMIAVPSFAAVKRKKIGSVSIDVEAHIELGDRYGDEEIEVTTRGKHYSYDYYEIENFGFEWTEDDVPEIIIYLNADDGYYFSLTKASSVRLSGATYVRAATQDNKETLKLQVKLAPMKEMLGAETEVILTDGGYASWDSIQGAGSYELRLYRNDTGVGPVYQTTDQIYYDYTTQMSKPGSYRVKVRAVNKQNTESKGKWMESEVITISADMADAIRNGTAPGLPVKGKWKTVGEKWWYEHEDGTYTKNDWELIDKQWYFFNEEGYMVTGWIEWNGEKYYLDDQTGAMLKNTTTPDGYLLDGEGHLKNH